MSDAPWFPPPPSYIPPGARRTAECPTGSQRCKISHVGRPLASYQATAELEKGSYTKGAQRPLLHRSSTWRLRPSSRIWTLVDEWWLWELLSWTFAAFCMVAIAGLLASYNDRALPTWPWGLTINAYVSILGAFAKAALLLPTAEALGQLKFNWFFRQSREVGDFQIFDQASRGPWGSLVLIMKTRGRALGALGAAIILLSTAMDPFFQQVVTYPSRHAVIGNSSITRSRLYTAGVFDPQYINEGLPTVYPDRAIGYYVSPLLYYNFTPQLPEVPLTCTTGECAWEPYYTLGVCNECSDVSHLLQFACLESENRWLTNVTNSVQAHYPKGESCGYFLNATSKNPKLMTGYALPNNSNDTLLGRILSLNIPVDNRQSFYNGSIMFKDVADPIVDALYVFTPGGYDAVHRNATPVAKECNLHWCVQRVNSTVRRGSLEETVLESIVNRTAQPYPFSANWTELEYDYRATPRITLEATKESFGLQSNRSAFMVATGFMESMGAFFTANKSTSESWMRYTWQGTTMPMYAPADSTFWWNPHNVTRHFDNIARAMTRVVRISSNGTDDIVGVALGPQTYVHIRWEWFSLPLIILSVSFIFLLLVMVQCRTDGTEIWKTSALAVLMHGLSSDEASERLCGCTDGVNAAHMGVGPSVEQDRVMVRLRGDSGRWRFTDRLSRQGTT